MEAASFASALTSALSSMLSPRTSEQLRQIGVSEKQLHAMKEKFKSIQMFVEDVSNRSELRDDVTCWLQKVNELTFRVQKAIDKHEYELLGRNNRAWKKPSVLSLEFRMRLKVKKIFNLLIELENEVCKLELVKNVHVPRSLPSFNREIIHHHLEVSEFVGRLEDQRKIVPKLHFESEFTIAIVGMAGIGKTTFAARIYGNELPGNPFAKKFWVTAGGIFNETEILEKMQWPLESESQGERVLLVLDDVQSVKQEQFNNLVHRLLRGGAKIKVLVTTRRAETARIIGASYAHELQGLSADDSWDLFRRAASRTTPTVGDMENVGRQILQKCHGVPLDIRRLASLLQTKENVSDWEILSNMSFTYNGVPKALKRCFAYCSLFPKEATIQKYDLIGLWVAQGFLPQETVDRSIDTGEIYFDVSLNESLLKVSKQDEDGTVVDCTMHALVHDLAMHFSGHDMFIIDDQRNRPISRQSDVQHLVFSPRNISVAKAVISQSTRLRTIYVVPENAPYPMVAVLKTMLSQARYLYVLKLDGIGLKEVPKNLGKLNYLQYLDLSNNPIKYVPESIAHLYLLQTLLLRSCEKLKNTENPPKGIANLTYLSFVEVSPKQFPKKMLPPTVRNMQPPIELDEKGFTKLSEVRDLKDIAGLLRINDLEYVEDKKASQEAKIGKKHRLSALELHWSRERLEAGNSHHKQDEDVLDGLQPHPNIQRLKLINYASQQFPMWVMNMKVEDNERRLYKLVKIELVECKRCLQHPTMGQLPCLQELLTVGMDNIERIGEELYIYADGSEDKDSLEELFPALRRLELRDLSRLTEWQPALTRGKKCQTFLKLETLQVVNCPKLTCIPIDSTGMINLLIQGIQRSDWLDNIIANSCKNQTLTSLVLSRVPDLTTLPKELSQCTSLEELKLQECQNIKQWPPNPWNL